VGPEGCLRRTDARQGLTTCGAGPWDTTFISSLASGATVTRKLSWLPPKGSVDGEIVTAVVVVSDSSGQKRFHTLKIRTD
jgi:hypothetical protein